MPVENAEAVGIGQEGVIGHECVTADAVGDWVIVMILETQDHRCHEVPSFHAGTRVGGACIR